MLSRQMQKMVNESLDEIVSPELEKRGFQKEVSVTVERDKIWRYIKNINGLDCEIIFKPTILNTVEVDFYVPFGMQISITTLDPEMTFEKKLWGYKFKSEESLKEQLEYLKGIVLEKGISKLEDIANRGKPMR